MRSIRLLPWLLSTLAAILVLGTGMPGRGTTHYAPPSGSGEGTIDPAERSEGPQSRARSAQGLPCGELQALSEQAAALTGSLALVGPGERPARAKETAARVRGLAVQAAALEGGGELAGVLSDLADGLEGYAGGDPASLAAVQEASEANAHLRAAYAACVETLHEGERALHEGERTLHEGEKTLHGGER